MKDLRRIIWLASFPKSGNTWTRSFLANYFQPPGKMLDINSLIKFTTADVRQDYFDRANGSPFRGETMEDWIRVRPEALRLIAASNSGHHFVKTHCPVIKIGEQDLIMPEVTAAAIYLMRNPFDVALSYARHLALDADAAIDRMCDRHAVQANENRIMEVVGRWDDHIRTWTEARGLPKHVMRYEDMVMDADKAFRDLFGFLQIPVKREQLSRALEQASFTSMQKQERQKGFRERPQNMEQFFTRGTSGGWRQDLTSTQVVRIRTEFLAMLERWYPEMLDETQEMAGDQ